ncbi:MAG: cell division protein FtsH, partial [Leptospiraceae bacterium]|nr:cell division protein FtsH [Leptospiraceae bacterium]
ISYNNDNDNVFLGREIGAPRHYSDETATAIDEEVRRIVEEQLNRGRSMLSESRDRLDKIAKALLARESITGNELNALIHGDQAEGGNPDDADPDSVSPGGVNPNPAPAH